VHVLAVASQLLIASDRLISLNIPHVALWTMPKNLLVHVPVEFFWPLQHRKVGGSDSRRLHPKIDHQEQVDQLHKLLLLLPF
jgi:hypothetical protein